MLTGSDPKNLAVLGDKTARRFAEQFLQICGDNQNYGASVQEMEFIKIKRTADGYQTRLVDVHRREDGQYAWAGFDLDSISSKELMPILRAIKVGDSVTYCLKGKNLSEIIRKRESYFKPRKRTAGKKEIRTILSHEHLTEEQLKREHPHQRVGNDSDGYVRAVTVANESGLHARPAAMFVKAAAKYDCDVSAKKNGRTASGKSIMGMMTLECPKGTEIIIEARGPDAKDCLDELVRLVESKFGES